MSINRGVGGTILKTDVMVSETLTLLGVPADSLFKLLTNVASKAKGDMPINEITGIITTPRAGKASCTFSASADKTIDTPTYYFQLMRKRATVTEEVPGVSTARGFLTASTPGAMSWAITLALDVLPGDEYWVRPIKTSGSGDLKVYTAQLGMEIPL